MLRCNEGLKWRRFGQHSEEHTRRWPSRGCDQIDACARSPLRFRGSVISIFLVLLACSWIASAVSTYPDGKKFSCSYHKSRL